MHHFYLCYIVSIYSSDLRYDEDDEIYGPSSRATRERYHLPSYTFTVCDSILNIGPIVDSVIDEPTFQDESESVPIVQITRKLTDTGTDTKEKCRNGYLFRIRQKRIYMYFTSIVTDI
jgi:hypothetical protein